MIVQTTTLDTEAKVKAIYGGETWARLDNMFLVGAGTLYDVNATGGSATNMLTVENLPSHTHGLNNHTHGVGTLKATSAGSHTHTIQWRQAHDDDGAHNRWYMCSAPDKTTADGVGYSGTHEHSILGTTSGSSGNTTATGSGTAINNLPPYKAVYIWERTA